MRCLVTNKFLVVFKATFKWVRGELIGKGTYGRVYLAMNATTGEMIAVKQVELPQTASDKYDSRQHTVVQALKMESETLKDLDHPNIVQYLGFEETSDNLSMCVVPCFWETDPVLTCLTAFWNMFRVVLLAAVCINMEGSVRTLPDLSQPKF